MSSIYPFEKMKLKDCFEIPRSELHKTRAHEHHFKKNSKMKQKRVFKVYKTKTMCLIQRTK